MADVATDPWGTFDLDLDGYLDRLGIPARPPSRAALDELHEAHVQTFPFDNVDVLLDQHPGVSLLDVQGKFVRRGRGGYCFEHATIMAAALERLGYRVTRRLGRVGDPSAEPPPARGRSHMTLEVLLDDLRLWCDPGFGLSIMDPVPLVDGHEVEQAGSQFRVTRGGEETAEWWLHRARGDRWEPMHSMDEAAVLPEDVKIAHHYTSTFPASHFRHELIVARYLPDRHVTVTERAVTVRRPGLAAAHRELTDHELPEWLGVLGAALTGGETSRLLERLMNTGDR